MPKSFKTRRLSTFSLLILFCFFFSGIAGLIYQILWLRMIDKVIGSAPFAVATVLSVFMGGLALGSWLAGKHIDRIGSRRNLLSLYGKVELAIGIYGLLLPLFIHLAKPIYVLAYNALFVHFWLYRIFAFFGCSVLLLIPTTLMGVTLPVLCRFYVENLGHIGARTGRLYGINTIGGAVGAALCGFFLIAKFGVWGSLFTAVGINILIGALSVAVARRDSPLASAMENTDAAKPEEIEAASEQGHTESVPAEDRLIITLALWIFGISGFCAMAYEVFWTRLIGLIIGPTTYSFSVVVSTFIVGLAIGNILFGRLADRVKGTFRLLVITQICAAVLALLVSQFLGNSQFFFSKLIYTFQDNFGEKILVQSVVLFFVLVGPTIFLGATFPLVNRIYARSLPQIGKSIGTAYAMNTIGAILGSFIAGFILIPLLGKENGLRLVAGLQVVTSLFALTYLILKTGERVRAIATGLVTLSMGLALLVNFPSWNHNILSRGWYHQLESFERYFNTTSWFGAVWEGASKFAHHVANIDVVFYGDGIGGFTTVVKWFSTTGMTNYTLLNSGKADASSRSDRLTQALSAHIPLLFHPDPEKVMIIGLASGMTAGEVLYYPVKKVDVLEINDQVVKAAEFFNPWNNHCLTNPRTHLILQDGRNHLELTREKYDIIISEPSNPWMAGLANLFTLDYFKTVRGRLSENGIFVQWFYSYEMDWPTFSMVGRTFAEVFPDGILMKTMSSDYLLVGFKGKKNLDLKTADKNLDYAKESTNITIRDPRVLFNLIVSEDLKALFGPGPFHTDNWPRLEFAAPKNLDRMDASIEDEIKDNGRLSEETQKIVASNNNIDASLDFLELMTADASPPFKDVDLGKATPAQAQRYKDIFEKYCSEEDVESYSIFPGSDYQKEAAGLQAAKIQAHLAASQENTTAYYYLARAFNVMGNTREEMNALRKAISLDPTFYDAYMELGIALRTQGRSEEAIDQFKAALEIKPDSADAYNNMGNVMAMEGESGGAVDYYSMALRINPDFVEAHDNIANVLLSQGNTEAAILHLSKAIQIDPKHVKTQIDYGRVLIEQGRLADALAHFIEALKSNPDNADLHTYKGLVLGQQGQMDASVDELQEALRLEPNHFLAHKNLGVTLLRQGKTEEAAGHLSAASEINPDDPAIHKILGAILVNQDHLEAAADHYSEALRLEPDSAENHDNLGVALAMMGQLKEAAEHFEKAIEIDSSFEAAKNHLEIARKETQK